MIPLLQLIWGSYKQNTFRVALVLIALIIACAGLSAVLVINAAAKSSYAASSQPFLQQVEQRIIPRNGHVLSKQDFATLRRLGFTQLVPVLRSSQSIVHPITNKPLRIQLLGIDTFSVFSYSTSQKHLGELGSKDGLPKDLATLWQPPYSSIIHEDFATRLSLNDGQSLLLDNGLRIPKLTVTAIKGLGPEIVMDIGQLQQVLGTEKISELLVVGEKSNQVTDALIAALPKHLYLDNINTGEQAEQLTSSFHLNLLAMACLMFVVCLFVVMNALYLLLMKRWQNLRIARQLGISRKHIYLAQIAELIIISLLCAPIGAIAGVFLAQLTSPLVSQTLQSLFDVRVSYTQVTYVSLIAQSFAACLLGAFTAAILPMLQLNTKLAKHNLTSNINSRHTTWLSCSVVLSIAAVCTGYFSESMLISFMAIALTIFAGCSLLIYLLPKLLTTLFNYMPERWVLCRWLAADGVRLSQKSKIACCAFFIALTSNVGMNLMVDSFRQATQQWLSQRLVADLYVSTESPQLFTQWLSTQNIELELVERKSLDAVLINQTTGDTSNYVKEQIRQENRQNLQLRSYPSNRLYQQAMLFENQQANTWQLFESGEGVLVNQQLALRYKLTLGDKLSFQVELNQPEQKTIVGVYYDYGNQGSQVLLNLDSFAKYNAKTTRFALHFSDKQQQTLFIEQLSLSKISNQVAAISTRDILTLSMQTFERTFVITDGLNIVTLLVAALSLGTSVLMIDMDNRPQRALLRSMGVGNYQLAGLSLLQYTLLSLVACLVALPFGIGLTWLLINLINVQAFNWSYPMLITPSKLIFVSVMSVAVIMLVVILPLYRLSRRKLVEDIKCLSF